VQYFYKLTQRQFFNIVNGYRKKEDYLSRERWIIGRKMMFAMMGPYLPQNTKETEIISFPWEDDLIKELSKEEKEKAIQDHEASEAYWAKWDSRKRGEM
jgi:hypothetical protein